MTTATRTLSDFIVNPTTGKNRDPELVAMLFADWQRMSQILSDPPAGDELCEVIMQANDALRDQGIVCKALGVGHIGVEIPGYHGFTLAWDLEGGWMLDYSTKSSKTLEIAVRNAVVTIREQMDPK